MDWTALYLFELIFMRMTGFVVLNPIFGHNAVSNLAKGGLIMVLSIFLYTHGSFVSLEVPQSNIVHMMQLILELAVGFAIGFVIRLFFMVIQFGGEVIDIQMGLSMAQMYDPATQINMTVTASLLNVLFIMNFFAQNGHYTLLRIMLTSGEVIPFGTATLGAQVSTHMVEIFLACLTLAVKLALPILAAEMLSTIGMGILMKAIPQINAFVINIELKVVIGLAMLFLLFTPMSEFLLMVEVSMLDSVRDMLATMSIGG